MIDKYKSEILSSKSQLIDWFEKGCKPKNKWKVGTEHEKFALKFNKKKNKYLPVSYGEENGINDILHEISKFGWKKILEKEKVIALKKCDQSITLEPGGQIELSGAPLYDIHSTCKETNEHLKLLKEVGNKLNIILLGLGSRPYENTIDIPWMPKERYKIMREYMPKKGTKGLDMMLSTCTVQANLDYSSEEDMVRKTSLAVRLQPIITALFANSPFSLGNPNGFLSIRSHIWADTDSDRCGVLKVALEKDFSFKKYIDYALSVPMYFVIRNNNYLNCAGKSFADFMEGKLEQFPGERPTLKDWEDHISTIFTEVRLKKFIEVRGADAGSWSRTCALPAFWVGILYDQDCLEAAEKICKNWNFNDIKNLSQEVSVSGLNTRIKNSNLLDLSKEFIAISKEGLRKRGIRDSAGQDETGYVGVLEEIVTLGKTPAETMIDNFTNKWNEDINKLIKGLSY